MKKKKLNLEKLKVKSFVTTDGQMNADTVKGGIININNTPRCVAVASPACLPYTTGTVIDISIEIQFV